jgi:hypothetical protein
MANTELNVQLLLRRDSKFNESYKLAQGEPGFEVSTNTLKIGDGVKTWAELPIANKGLDDSYKTIQEAIAKVETDANVFIDTIAQNENGEIAITTKAVDFSAGDNRFKKLQTAIEAVATAKNVFVEQIAQDAQGVITISTKAVDFSAYRTAADQDDIDATFKIKQGAKTFEGTTAQTITKVEQNANGEVEVTYGDIAFPTESTISIVDDSVADIPETETVNVYKNLTADGHILTEELVEVATAKGVQAVRDYVGEIPADENGAALADSIVDYINKKTDGIATDSNLQLLADRVGAVESAVSTINNEETGVLAQAKAYVDSEDVFHTDIKTVNALGGIAAGADLNNMTTHEILNTLLFPYVAFTLGSTSRNAAATTLENGASQTLNSASISITKKSKPITSVKLLNGSTVLGEKTGDEVAAGGTITFSNLGITVDKNNNPNLKFTVTDGQTSTDKNVGASTFVYPYYWGVCSKDAAVDEALIESYTKRVQNKTNNQAVTFDCDNQRMVFAYPKAHGALVSILDPNNFETLGDYTRSEVSITGLDGTAQTYYVYVSGAGTASGFKVQFKLTK